MDSESVVKIGADNLPRLIVIVLEACASPTAEIDLTEMKRFRAQPSDARLLV